MVIAALCDRHVPVDEPIDLINVSFDPLHRSPDRVTGLAGLVELQRQYPRRYGVPFILHGFVSGRFSPVCDCCGAAECGASSVSLLRVDYFPCSRCGLARLLHWKQWMQPVVWSRLIVVPTLLCLHGLYCSPATHIWTSTSELRFGLPPAARAWCTHSRSGLERLR